MASVNQPDTAHSPESRHYLEAFALRLVVALFRPFTVDQASWLMGKIWRHCLPMGRRNRRVLGNLALILPHLSQAQRQTIAADLRENLGRVFIEAFRLSDIMADASRFDLTATQVLSAMPQDERGCVIASLHQGNWETCALATLRLGFAPGGVYRELTNPIVEAYLLKSRAPFYPAGLFCKRPGSDLARKLISLLKSGTTVTMLGDLRDDDGVRLNFLGHPSSAMAGPAFLARMTGRPLIAGRMVRTSGVHFKGEAIEIEVPRTDDRQADIAEATRRLSAVFETWILDAPNQWLWTHRKWNLAGET